MHQAVRTIAAVVAVLVPFAPQAHAALIVENLGVLVVEGPGTGETGTIDVAYDDALLVTGDEILGPDEMALTLTLFGQIFTNSDDADYPEGFPPVPAVGFLSFEISFIDFVIAEHTNINAPANPTAIDDSRIGFIGGVDLVDGVWQVRTEPVPEPATLALLGLGVAGLSLMRRKTGA